MKVVCFGQIHQTINYFIYSRWNRAQHNRLSFSLISFCRHCLLRQNKIMKLKFTAAQPTNRSSYEICVSHQDIYSCFFSLFFSQTIIVFDGLLRWEKARRREREKEIDAKQFTRNRHAIARMSNWIIIKKCALMLILCHSCIMCNNKKIWNNTNLRSFFWRERYQY